VSDITDKVCAPVQKNLGQDLRRDGNRVWRVARQCVRDQEGIFAQGAKKKEEVDEPYPRH